MCAMLHHTTDRPLWGTPREVTDLRTIVGGLEEWVRTWSLRHIAQTYSAYAPLTDNTIPAVIVVRCTCMPLPALGSTSRKSDRTRWEVNGGIHGATCVRHQITLELLVQNEGFT